MSKKKKEEVVAMGDSTGLTRNLKSSYVNYPLVLTIMDERKCRRRDISKQIRKKSLPDQDEGIRTNSKSAILLKGLLN